MCGHLDWPCCGCDDGLEHFDDSDICPGCEEPEAYCVCDQYEDEPDPGWADGDHETGLASAGWGVDEDYLPGGYDEL
jgi:hypothetical protein